MPLDTSSYTLAHLRLDGRRWNELRHMHAQISTQAAADGSSYLEMGNTKVLCTVSGPSESRRTNSSSRPEASLETTISLAGFSGTDRKKPASGTDKRISEMQMNISSAFSCTLLTHLYPHSVISVHLHVLAQDGGLLAACINATTLALVDAGIPMTSYISACTAGSTSSYATNDQDADPLLDLNSLEEQELPFLTIGTQGTNDKVCVLNMETRVQMDRVEAMMAVGIDGSKSIRAMLDDTVRAHGKEMLAKKR